MWNWNTSPRPAATIATTIPFGGCFDIGILIRGKKRIDNLFKTCIEAPTLKIQKEKDWVVSVLWDNAGVARFDEEHYYLHYRRNP